MVQTHNETASLFKTLKSLLIKPDLQRVRIAAAYARWDGIGLISNELEQLVVEITRLVPTGGMAKTDPVVVVWPDDRPAR